MTERLSTAQHLYSCLEIAWAEEPGRLQSMELQSWTRLNDRACTNAPKWAALQPRDAGSGCGGSTYHEI